VSRSLQFSAPLNPQRRSSFLSRSRLFFIHLLTSASTTSLLCCAQSIANRIGCCERFPRIPNPPRSRTGAPCLMRSLKNPQNCSATFLLTVTVLPLLSVIVWRLAAGEIGVFASTLNLPPLVRSPPCRHQFARAARVLG